MNLIGTTMFLVFCAYYFLQCYPWDGYEWSQPSKNIKQELYVVEGKRGMRSPGVNWIYSPLCLTPAQGLLSGLMRRSLLFKGVPDGKLGFRAVEHFHLLIILKEAAL